MCWLMIDKKNNKAEHLYEKAVFIFTDCLNGKASYVYIIPQKLDWFFFSSGFKIVFKAKSINSDLK